MQNRQEQIESIEITLDQAKKTVERKKAMDRLIENKDWKALMDQDYFKEEASRLVLLKADENMQDPEQQSAIEKAIIGIGALHAYLRTVQQLGRIAERSIAADEHTREELLAEELEGEVDEDEIDDNEL